jgi:MFS transporter, DHA2 family, multidrug resistance protein
MTTASSTLLPLGDAAVQHKPVNKWIVTVAVSFGTLMGAIDMSIVNVAIPHMQGALGASIDEITWVSTGFIIANVIVMPLVAWLGRRLGRKNVYQACMLLFIVGSFFCGTARSLTSLVVFRVMQGLGAGGLQPTEQAILRETFPLEEQAMAMSLFGLAVMLGPALGPTLGGWIVDNMSWPWIFYVNLPIGVIGLMMVQRFVHDPDFITEGKAAARRESIDYMGLVLLSVGLFCVQLMLERGDRDGWWDSPFVVTLALLGGFGLAAFIVRELTTDHPIVDLSILKYRSYSAGTFIGAVLGVSLFGSMFMLPLFFEDQLGLTALQSGLDLMPRTLAMAVAMPISAWLFNRLGARLLVAAGLLVGGIAAFQMSLFTADSSTWDLIAPQITQGLGFSCIFVALSTAALSPIPRERMSAATGLYNLVRNMGGSVGTVTIAVLFERATTRAFAVFASHTAPGRFEVQQRLAMIDTALRQRTGSSSHLAQIAALEGVVRQQATLVAFERIFAIIAFIFLASIPLVFLIENVKPQAKRPPEPVEA